MAVMQKNVLNVVPDQIILYTLHLRLIDRSTALRAPPTPS